MPTKPREIKIAQRGVGESLVRREKVRGELSSFWLAARGGLWVYWELVSLRSEGSSSAIWCFRFLLPPRKVDASCPFCLERFLKFSCTENQMLGINTVSPCRSPTWSLCLYHEDFFFYRPGGGTILSNHLPRIVLALLLLVTLLLHALCSEVCCR